MEKLLYLTKTLSRTKRKDYENYVVNAIWNRVNNPWLVPVTQQCVKADDGTYYFIDLYFPQLNIGIECDEQHHLKQSEADKTREINIADQLKPIEPSVFDVLTHVRIDDFEMLRVEAYKGYDETEKQINLCVKRIKEKIKSSPITNGWQQIVLVDPQQYYENKKVITTADNVRFASNCVAYNTIFGKNYSNSLWKGGSKIKKEYYSWFPEINSVADESNKNGWQNQISKDGKYIYERKRNITKEKIEKSKKEIGCLKVTFVKLKNEFTEKKDYRFAGVYKCTGVMVDEENNCIKTYEKKSDEFEIIK